MELLNLNLAKQYKSPSQKIRVLTETWVGENIFCPHCGNSLSNKENNNPVGDFYCKNCYEEYELKSKKNALGRKINDGAYKTIIERLNSRNNPSFFFWQARKEYCVTSSYF